MSHQIKFRSNLYNLPFMLGGSFLRAGEKHFCLLFSCSISQVVVEVVSSVFGRRTY